MTAANADISGPARKCPEPMEPGLQFVMISVTDSGSGMSRNTLGHIFEPFFTTKPKGKGTGLGLSTVYGIVKQHNGWIEVRSEEGKGSVFTIYLPEAPAETVKAAAPAAVGDLRGRGEQVLVVEDDKALRELTVRMLKENGYAPVEAATGSEAAGLFMDKKYNFSIVFMDMVLSDRNGAELITELKRTAPGTGFVLTTGYMEDKSTMDSIRGRGCGFIAKPYSIETVLKTFKNLLPQKK